MPKSPLDPVLREAKERFILEGQKAIIVINGAGAVALLAFLQAIWGNEQAAPLLKPVLWGIVFFAVGVALGASTYELRHWQLRKRAFKETDFLFQLCYIYFPSGSIVAFLLGLLVPVIGAFLAL